MRLSRLLPALLLVPAAVLGSCNGGDDTGPADTSLAILHAPGKSGDGQEGTVNEALTDPIRVLVTRDGEPAEGVSVEWRADNDGLMGSARTSTDAEGIAENLWILGPEPGPQTASALLDDAEGSPLGFTATAEEAGPPPGLTIQLLPTAFDPANVTVSLGQTVTWVWPAGSPAHNVVPDDGSIPSGSGPLTTGPATYTFTFSVPGVYRYYCMAHGGPNGVGMSGTITVLNELP